MKRAIHTKIVYSLIGTTLPIGLILTLPTASATTENTVDATATVKVRSACYMTATVAPGEEHTATVLGGSYTTNIGKTTIQTICNDAGGYAIYAIGFTGGVMGNTKLHSSELGNTYDITTGTATGSGANDPSNWAMKLAPGSAGNTPTIVDGFDNYSAVPSNFTKVASFDSTTGAGSIGSSVTTTYAAYISPLQPAGTYVGQVRYALVHPSAPTTNYVLQNIADWKGELLPGQSVTATDNRDGKSYTVALLEDGNVWMTQNLDLCIGCTGTAALNSTNTDLNTDLGSAAGYSTNAGVITWGPAGNATVTGTPAEITNYASGNPANSVTGWTDSNTAPYMATGSFHEQTGNYYNYTAAIAMNDSSSISANYSVAPNSICPAGWRLPNGLTQTDGVTNISDFNTLLNAYGIAGGNDTAGNQNVDYAAGGFAKIEVNPLNFARSGNVGDTTLYDYTTDGYYWSSTTYSGTNSYNLVYSSGDLYPAGRNRRHRGRSVRCMARKSIGDLNFLQDFAKLTENEKRDVISSMNEGETYQLRDDRDDAVYRIAKLADGKVWFLDNLALDPTDPSVTINENNTNATAAQLTAYLDSETGVKNVSENFNSYTAAQINTGSKNDTAILAMGQSGANKIGAYYNYCAATAGTYCMDENSGSGNASYDICPKGWRLPTGGESGEYQNLRNQYLSNADFAKALRIPLSGDYFGSSARYQGAGGYFWSSTFYTAVGMYGLNANASAVYPQSLNNRYRGFSVRCVLN